MIKSVNMGKIEKNPYFKGIKGKIFSLAEKMNKWIGQANMQMIKFSIKKKFYKKKMESYNKV